MKTLFTSEAIADNGRTGNLRSPDGLLDVQLGHPLKPGMEKRGPNPELLFAGAYAACYHGALLNAAERLGVDAKDSRVRALVSLMSDGRDDYRLAVELRASIPGTDRAGVERVMAAAHETCPYSKALLEHTEVKLTAE